MFITGPTTATESVLVGSNAKFDRIHYLYETLCAIWYHLYNLNNVKIIYGGVLLLVKLKPANLLKVTLLGWCSHIFKLYKWYQIAQKITYSLRINRLFLRLSQNIAIRRKAVSKIISSNGWSRKFYPPEIIKKPSVI